MTALDLSSELSITETKFVKHALFRAITSVAVALILLAEAHAIETARAITLVPGWSAVWLDVDPVETAGDDAGLSRLVEDVFADPAVTIVARPDVPVGSAEFVSDPREKSFNQDGRWLMWCRNSELGANTESTRTTAAFRSG